MTLQKWYRFLNEVLNIVPDSSSEEVPPRYLKKIHDIGELPLYAPILNSAHFDPFEEPSLATLWLKTCNVANRQMLETVDLGLMEIEPSTIVDFSTVKTINDLIDAVEQVNSHIAECYKAIEGQA